MKSHDLFDLIHSLTPAEKGYFKKFISLHGKGEKKYVKLFDAINAQKEHNEEAIKKKLGKEISNLSMAKGHLFDMVLQAMHVFQSNKEFLPRFNRLVEDGAFLEGRSLVQAAAAKYEAAYRFADGNLEAFHAIYAWGQWNELQLINSELSHNLPNIDEYEKERERLMAEVKGMADRYTIMYYTVSRENKEGMVRTPKQLKALREGSEEYFNRLLQNSSSRIARYTYNYLKGHEESSAGNYVKTIRLNMANAEILHQYPLFKQYSSHRGIFIYSNIMVNYRSLQLYEQWEKAVKKVKNELELHGNELEYFSYAPMQVNIAVSELRSYQRTGKPALAKKAAEELNSWIANPRNAEFTRHTNMAYKNLVLYYLAEGDKKKLITLCNNFLYGKVKFAAADCATMHVILLLQLIEDGDFEKLKGQITHAKKRIGVRDKVNEVLYFIIAFAEKVMKKKHTINIKPELKELRDKYEQFKMNNIISPLFFFNLNTWIESQLKGISYEQLIKESWQRSRITIKTETEAQLKELNLTWDDLKLPEWYWKE